MYFYFSIAVSSFSCRMLTGFYFHNFLSLTGVSIPVRDKTPSFISQCLNRVPRCRFPALKRNREQRKKSHNKPG